VIAGIAAALVQRADAVQVPAADYLSYIAGLQSALGAFATADIPALLVFAGMGVVLYRVARS
jgi:hypothetical protein